MEEQSRNPFVGKRKTVQVTGNSLTDESPITTALEKGIVLRPKVSGLSAIEWIESQVKQIDRLLDENGAVLLRGFRVQDAAEFRNFVEKYSGPLLDYFYRSTPRSVVMQGVFTSTDYPADQYIPQHNEMSYSRRWPQRLFFYCSVEPGGRGQTPIADSAKVFKRIPESIRRKFEKCGVRYDRNYGKRFDLTWQQAFQTNDRKAVEAYCLEHKIEWEWLSAGGLRTSQTCQATIQHPRTGEELWFNQAHLFHISNLPEETRSEMENGFLTSELPRNSVFGDGSSISVEDLEAIRNAYKEEEITFDWKENDILILDNVAMSHGRNPYTPPRKILVAMT